MVRKRYVGLLAISLLALVGFAVSIVVAGQASSPTEVEGTFTFLWILSSVMALVGWVWGIVLTAQNRQWVWMVLVVIFSPLSAGIYSVVRLLGGSKNGERRVA